MFWPPDVMNWLIGKDYDAEKVWRQEEKGAIEDDIVGWYPRFNGLEFEQAPGVSDGQGSLVWCNPWGRKELDTTEQLNWTETFMEEYFNVLFCSYITWQTVWCHLVVILVFQIFFYKPYSFTHSAYMFLFIALICLFMYF